MQKRYWLRGGIIALIIYAVVTVILVPFSTLGKECSVFCLTYWSIPSFIGSIIISFPIKILTGSTFFMRGSNVFFGAIYFYFIIGMVIGWVYGKIKRKNNINI